LAESADLYRLALVLSQLENDDTIAETMDKQLELWESQDRDMDPQLLEIYKLTGTLSLRTSLTHIQLVIGVDPRVSSTGEMH
jgi:hypothetical protein